MARLQNDQFGPSASAFDIEPKGPPTGFQGHRAQDLFDYLHKECLAYLERMTGGTDFSAAEFTTYCKKFFLDPANRIRGYSMVTGGLALDLTDGRRLVVHYEDTGDEGDMANTPFAMATEVKEKSARDMLPDGGHPLRPVPKRGR